MLLAAPFPGYVGAKGVERNGVTWQVFLGVLDLPSICSKPVGRMTKISSRQLPEAFFCDRVWSNDRLSLTASEGITAVIVSAPAAEAIHPAATEKSQQCF
jgi:hypothetical protein